MNRYIQIFETLCIILESVTIVSCKTVFVTNFVFAGYVMDVLLARNFGFTSLFSWSCNSIMQMYLINLINSTFKNIVANILVSLSIHPIISLGQISRSRVPKSGAFCSYNRITITVFRRILPIYNPSHTG